MLYIPKKIGVFADKLAPLLNWSLWVEPTLLVLMGVATGIIVEKVLIGATRKILNRISTDLNENIASLMRGVIRWVFALWGAYAATFNMEFLKAGSLEMIRQVLFVITMFIAIRLLAQMSVAVARFYLNHAFAFRALPNTSIFENLIRLVVYIFGIIMLLQTMGISVGPLIAALGVGGLAISLALQDTLANLFAGVNMILARQIRIGDTIKLENGLSGKVIDIGWRTTTLRQLSGDTVILPNNKMAQSITINYLGPHPDLAVSLQMAIPLSADLNHLETVALEEARSVGKRLLAEKPNLEKQQGNFAPVVQFASFGESWVNMNVVMPFSIVMDGGKVRHELLKALHTRLTAEKVHMPFPQRVIHMDWPQALESVPRPTEDHHHAITN